MLWLLILDSQRVLCVTRSMTLCDVKSREPEVHSSESADTNSQWSGQSAPPLDSVIVWRAR